MPEMSERDKMTTKVTITAEIHNQETFVEVRIMSGDTFDRCVTIGPGESTEQYVYEGQALLIREVNTE